MTEDLKTSKRLNKNGMDVPKRGEPTDSDPCIEMEKPSERSFVNDTERILRQKTGLSKKGLYVAGAVLLVLLLLLITVIALAACWPRTPHHLQFPICKDTSCLRAAAQVREALNSSISPCDDLWNWACGGWLNKHPLPPDRSIWNQRQQLAYEEAVRIRDLITTLPMPLHTGTVEWKLKHLYEACLDVDNVNADQARPLTTIISELGGWSILRDWSFESFDYNVILRQLHSKYGVTPYFKVSVEPNPRSPGNNSITISPAGLGLPDRTYYYGDQDNSIELAYKQLIRDVVINLSATKIDAEKFGNDIFYYEKRIAEITPDSFDLQNPINTYNLVKISELKVSAATLPIQDVLNAMYPETPISDETEVIVKSVDYLNKISQIVASTDRNTLNSYVMWCLVREYLPYLSTKFTSTLDSFTAELLGIQQSPKRWEVCAKLVQKFMGVATDFMLEKRTPISNNTIRFVQKVYQEIINVAKKNLLQYERYPDLYAHLLNKLNRLNLQIGLPPEVTNEGYIKNYHTKLMVLKANLFQSFKNGIQFLKKIEERRLTHFHPEDNLISCTLSWPSKICYSPTINAIIVPRPLLTYPMFEVDYPRAIIYGRLGIDIANAVISSLLPFESYWGGDSKLLTPFHSIVNDSLASVAHGRHCLAQMMVNENLGTPKTADLRALATLKQLSALKLAGDALNEVENDPHMHQPSLEEYEDPALFYLAYAQTHCSILSNQQEVYDNVINFKIKPKLLLNIAWKQVPEFSKSLNCVYGEKTQCSDIF